MVSTLDLVPGCAVSGRSTENGTVGVGPVELSARRIDWAKGRPLAPRTEPGRNAGWCWIGPSSSAETDTLFAARLATSSRSLVFREDALAVRAVVVIVIHVALRRGLNGARVIGRYLDHVASRYSLPLAGQQSPRAAPCA
jgi:hypothetical protein